MDTQKFKDSRNYSIFFKIQKLLCNPRNPGIAYMQSPEF